MAKKAPKIAGAGRCEVCHSPFLYQSVRIPSVCGALFCRAIDSWGPDEWEGAARMAAARRDANRQIRVLSAGFKVDSIRDEKVFRYAAEIVSAQMTPLDDEALARFPQ